MKTEIKEVIERLCIELGYPNRKLSYDEYMGVLNKAHQIVFQKRLI